MSYLRDQNVGMPLGRADHVVGEMTPFPTRYWYFDAQTGSWKFNDGLSTPVLLEKQPNPKQPPSTLEIDIFKERSVAATEWKLTVFTKDASTGLQLLNVDEADDIEMYVYHHAYTRP